MQMIHGKQLIYTRVEREYSPQRTNGYQIVYVSNGLPQIDISSIEETVQGYNGKNVGETRWQFFTTPNKYKVMAVTRLIQGNPKINDRYARDVVLSHCVIVNEQEFLDLYGNPFIIFDNFKFIDNSEDLILNFNQEDQREPLCEFSPYNLSPSKFPGKWVNEATLFLQLFECTANKAVQNHVQFIGEHEKVAEVLRTIFFFIPIENRYLCSFDTSRPGIEIKSLKFWSIGNPERYSSIDYFYDIASGNIFPVLSSYHSPNSYYQWVAHYSKELPITEFLSQVPGIQRIDYAFEKRMMLSQNQLDQNACETYIKLYSKLIKENVRLALGKSISENLTSKFLDYYFNYSLSPFAKIIISASQVTQNSDVAMQLREWILHEAPAFKRFGQQDWKDLRDFSQRNNDPVIFFWSNVNLGDQKLASSAIIHMTPKEYTEALKLFNNPFDIRFYLSKNHIRLFLNEVQPILKSLPDDVVVNVIITMIDFGQFEFLDMFISRIDEVDNKSLTALEKKINGVQRLPNGFTMAISARRRKLGPPSNPLKTFFGRK